MRKVLLLGVLLLPIAASAQSNNPEAHGPFDGNTGANAGQQASPVPVMQQPTQPIAPTTVQATAAAANVYQTLFGACPHGGLIENTSNTTASNAFEAFADWTGGATIGGPATNGSTTIDPAATQGHAGGKQVIPPTSNPVLWQSPNVGATVRASCS